MEETLKILSTDLRLLIEKLLIELVCAFTDKIGF